MRDVHYFGGEPLMESHNVGRPFEQIFKTDLKKVLENWSVHTLFTVRFVL